MILLLFICINASPISQVLSHSMRFRPNQDLTKELLNYITTQNIQAASISTCVGVIMDFKMKSLLKCKIRFANQPQYTTIEGHFEIVSLVGTISIYGNHIHISLSDEKGNMIGGHLPLEDNECLIYTTAEVVFLQHVDSIFVRQIDKTYGYAELVVL